MIRVCYIEFPSRIRIFPGEMGYLLPVVPRTLTMRVSFPKAPPCSPKRMRMRRTTQNKFRLYVRFTNITLRWQTEIPNRTFVTWTMTKFDVRIDEVWLTTHYSLYTYTCINIYIYIYTHIYIHILNNRSSKKNYMN